MVESQSLHKQIKPLCSLCSCSLRRLISLLLKVRSLDVLVSLQLEWWHWNSLSIRSQGRTGDGLGICWGSKNPGGSLAPMQIIPLSVKTVAAGHH